MLDDDYRSMHLRDFCNYRVPPLQVLSLLKLNFGEWSSQSQRRVSPCIPRQLTSARNPPPSPCNPLILECSCLQGNTKYTVNLWLRSWLCHEFPSLNPPPRAFWYYQDDKNQELHACNAETVAQLERQYDGNARKPIDQHKFEMPIPIASLAKQHWVFEAISTTPT